MNADYLKQATSTKKTLQSESIPGRTDQTENNAGGFVFQVDDWTRLERFLILGSEGGSYYQGERELTRENADCVLRCVEADGNKTLNTIIAVSTGGRAAKNNPAIFALAACLKLGDLDTRRAAADAVPQVCRTGTHLFKLADYINLFGGWGPLVRRAFANWYNRETAKVAYQTVKYRQREGWSHRDLLRKAHVEPVDGEHNALFGWVTDPEKRALTATADSNLRIVEGFERAQASESPEETASLIREYDLPREALRTEHLSDPAVWEAMLNAGNGMPMTALIRNLGNMTRIGLLTPTSEATRTVLDQLADSERLRKARVHPLAVFSALTTYKQGRGMRGGGEWNVVAPIVDALDACFYEAFDNVEPTGKRHMLAIDVSNSMWYEHMFNLANLAPADGAAIMAMATARAESLYETVAFAGSEAPAGQRLYKTQSKDNRNSWRYDTGLMAMSVTPRMRLDSVQQEFRNLAHYGVTDCSLPMQYAMAEEREVDVFVVYTDNETWSGDIHPIQALNEYRNASGIPAKLIVAGMTATDFSIADPNDAGSLDVVGFDTNAPAVMADFIRH